jgi:hypothetical protein
MEQTDRGHSGRDLVANRTIDGPDGQVAALEIERRQDRRGTVV